MICAAVNEAQVWNIFVSGHINVREDNIVGSMVKGPKMSQGPH